MGASITNSVNREAVRAAYNLAALSGNKDEVEVNDFNGARQIVGDKEKKFNFGKIKTEANYGFRGKIVTKNELAFYFQQRANISNKTVIVILKSGQKLVIKPKVYYDAQEFAKAPIVRWLTTSPAQEVPDRLDDHFEKGNYTYEVRKCYIFPWQFYEEKRGACSAYSIFSHFILKQAGYSPRFFLIHWPQKVEPGKLRRTHDITVYRDKKTGLYNYFDHDGLHEVQTKTLQDLFTKSIPQWNKAEELGITNGYVHFLDDNKNAFIYRK